MSKEHHHLDRVDYEEKIGERGDFNEYLSVKNDGGSVQAVKWNDMPVYDERSFEFKYDDKGLHFIRGRESQSGTGEYRSVNPSQEVKDRVKDMIEGGNTVWI